MKKVVSEGEILDFAEGLPLGHDTENTLVSMLSGSPEFRRDLDEYRRDLARVDAGIPSITLTLDLASQLPDLAKAALKKRYTKEFSTEKFFRSREIVIVMGFVLSMLGLVAAYLWLWERN